LRWELLIMEIIAFGAAVACSLFMGTVVLFSDGER